MGMYHSTYFAYGFQIPDTDSKTLEEALKGQRASRTTRTSATSTQATTTVT